MILKTRLEILIDQRVMNDEFGGWERWRRWKRVVENITGAKLFILQMKCPGILMMSLKINCWFIRWNISAYLRRNRL